jgi:glycosyltransferase involved in cell wall biosynthesis
MTIDWQYHREINWIRNYLQQNPDMSVIVFLQPAIPIVLLAAQDLPNRIIISERADPNRLMKKRYGKKFIEKYYARADKAVFQTDDAMAVYPQNIAEKGTVIFNPLKENLPAPYHGERNNNITTFCRISNQKNLPLLVAAFADVHKKHPEYVLRIIGDAPNTEGEAVVQALNEQISSLGLNDAVIFEPFMKNVHKAVIKDAMYVSSSDSEGISNAMLEAMAIGMPVVCTDCPIGGAKAAITDGENGLLVPIKNADELAKAINRVIEDKELSAKLSENASYLRETISLNNIAKKWESLLGD